MVPERQWSRSTNPVLNPEKRTRGTQSLPVQNDKMKRWRKGTNFNLRIFIKFYQEVLTMNAIKNPPRFSSEKDYQTFKLELETWTKVTSHDKKNWGNVIALSLPEDDASDIQRKVFAIGNFDALDASSRS